MVACRHADQSSWCFYLINDSDVPVDSATLEQIDYEWGGGLYTEKPGRSISNLLPGAHAVLWPDDDGGAELRMNMSLRVVVGEGQFLVRFAFPKLYRRRGLPNIPTIGTPGYEVAGTSERIS